MIKKIIGITVVSLILVWFAYLIISRFNILFDDGYVYHGKVNSLQSEVTSLKSELKQLKKDYQNLRIDYQTYCVQHDPAWCESNWDSIQTDDGQGALCLKDRMSEAVRGEFE